MTPNDRWSWRSILDVGSSVLVSAVAIVLLLWIGVSLKSPPGPPEAQVPPRTRPSVPVPGSPLVLQDIPIMGESNAPVGLLVFSDFQCPFCGRFAREALASVIRSHVQTGKLFVGFRHLPLSTIHPMAVEAARTAECGRQQGRFWDVHDALFQSDAWVGSGIESQIGPLGLDGQGLRRCLSDPDTARRVQQDLSEARQLGVASTPTLFLGWSDGNGKFVVNRTEAGAISAADLVVAITKVAEAERR